MHGKRLIRLAGVLTLACTVPAVAQPVVPAAETRGTPAERAAQMLAQMTLDEKLTLLKGYFGTDFPPARFEAPAAARAGSAARRQHSVRAAACARHPRAGGHLRSFFGRSS